MQAAVPRVSMRLPGTSRRIRIIYRLSIIAVVSLLFVFGAHAALALWAMELDFEASAGTGWISLNVDGEMAFAFTCCRNDGHGNARCDSTSAGTPECWPPPPECDEESAAWVELTHTGSIPAAVYLQLLFDGTAGTDPLCGADLPGLTIGEDGAGLRYDGPACDLLPGAASSHAVLLVPQLDPGDSRVFRFVLARPHEWDGLVGSAARFIAIQWTDVAPPVPDLDATGLGEDQDAAWPDDPYGDDDDPAGRGFWFGLEHPLTIEVLGGGDVCQVVAPVPAETIPLLPRPGPVEPAPIDTPPPPEIAAATTATIASTTTTATTAIVTTTTTVPVATATTTSSTTSSSTTAPPPPNTTTTMTPGPPGPTSVPPTFTTIAPVATTTVALSPTTTAVVAPPLDATPAPIESPPADAPPPSPDPIEGDPVANDPRDTGLIGGVVPIEPPEDNSVVPPDSPARGRHDVE